ncbi:Myosin tail [Cichlidogyrus casuarinus]|uniref:Myosin tail n=1 Tax=Cichlidogyrus casuarinus TaxID=1844966 RepID=A0ABD2QNM7_9PLAT
MQILITNERENARNRWLGLMKAASTLDMDCEQEFAPGGISRMLGAIYHLGCARAHSQELNPNVCLFADASAGKRAAHLLGVSFNDLHSAIFNPRWTQIHGAPPKHVKGSWTPLDMLDGFANGLFMVAVDTLLSLINRSLNKSLSRDQTFNPTLAPYKLILLDPPGLQVPSACGRASGASFEDLIFNYLHERLFQFCYETSFGLQLKRMSSENVPINLDASFKETVSNQIETMILLLDRKPKDFAGVEIGTRATPRSQLSHPESVRLQGIIQLLDEAARTGTEDSFIRSVGAVYQEYKSKVFNPGSLLRGVRKCKKFYIYHALGTAPVEYNCSEWLRNCRFAPSRLHPAQLIKRSTDLQLKRLIENAMNVDPSTSSDEDTSLAMRSKWQVDELISSMRSSMSKRGSQDKGIHWVHCLLPVANAGLCELFSSSSRWSSYNRRNMEFSQVNDICGRLCCRLVRSQIRGLGLAPLLAASKATYCESIPNSDFRRLFAQSLSSTQIRSNIHSLSDKTIVDDILSHHVQSAASYYVTHNMTFLKFGVLESLIDGSATSISPPEIISNFQERFIIKLQALCRGYLVRRRYARHINEDAAVCRIQDAASVWLELKTDPWWRLYMTIRRRICRDPLYSVRASFNSTSSLDKSRNTDQVYRQQAKRLELTDAAQQQALSMDLERLKRECEKERSRSSHLMEQLNKAETGYDAKLNKEKYSLELKLRELESENAQLQNELEIKVDECSRLDQLVEQLRAEQLRTSDAHADELEELRHQHKARVAQVESQLDAARDERRDSLTEKRRLERQIAESEEQVKSFELRLRDCANSDQVLEKKYRAQIRRLKEQLDSKEAMLEHLWSQQPEDRALVKELKNKLTEAEERSDQLSRQKRNAEKELEELQQIVVDLEQTKKEASHHSADVL